MKAASNGDRLHQQQNFGWACLWSSASDVANMLELQAQATRSAMQYQYMFGNMWWSMHLIKCENKKIGDWVIDKWCGGQLTKLPAQFCEGNSKLLNVTHLQIIRLKIQMMISSTSDICMSSLHSSSAVIAYKRNLSISRFYCWSSLKMDVNGRDAGKRRTLGYRFLGSILSLRLLRICTNMLGFRWDDCKDIDHGLVARTQSVAAWNWVAAGVKAPKLILCKTSCRIIKAQICVA